MLNKIMSSKIVKNIKVVILQVLSGFIIIKNLMMLRGGKQVIEKLTIEQGMRMLANIAGKENVYSFQSAFADKKKNPMYSSLNLETKIADRLKNYTGNGNLDFFSDKGIVISMGVNIVYSFSSKGMVIPVFIGFPWGAAPAYAHKRGHLLRSVFAFPIAGGHLYYPSDREARADLARASVEMAQPYFGDYFPEYMELSYRELNSLLRDSEDYQVYALENIVPFSTLDPHSIVSPQFADIMFWDDFHILGNQNPLIVGGFDMLKLLHRYQLEAF